MPISIDIAIIGTGPQALTLVTHLLQKKTATRNRFVVVDPAGELLHQFAAFEIPHLRLPAVHHPDPILRLCVPLPRGGLTSCFRLTRCPVRRCFATFANR